jgi:RNA polymerase sigma-70 factor (ECF subfamily)
VAERHPLADEALMGELAEGRHDALGILYRRYAPLIAAMARRTLDSAAGEDIVQDVFVTVWRNAAAFAPARGTFRQWVRQIARRRILNELRTRRRRPLQCARPEDNPWVDRLPDRGAAPDELAWRASIRGTVRGAVERLPAAQRDVVGLAFFEGLTHAEVAGRLAMPLGTAKTRIRAGLKTLRSSLAPLVAEPDDTPEGARGSKRRQPDSGRIGWAPNGRPKPKDTSRATPFPRCGVPRRFRTLSPRKNPASIRTRGRAHGHAA